MFCFLIGKDRACLTSFSPSGLGKLGVDVTMPG